jgi:hypothetical protein
MYYYASSQTFSRHSIKGATEKIHRLAAILQNRLDLCSVRAQVNPSSAHTLSLHYASISPFRATRHVVLLFDLVGCLL